MREAYQRPEVLSSGVSPEPVEAGCCLTSCGGSPGGLQSGKHQGDAAQDNLKLLEEQDGHEEGEDASSEDQPPEQG